jgi:pimeloyl-ACP methyl ester carboxylesterase
VIQGDRDEFAPISHAQAIAACIPNSESWIVPRCGHTPHTEWADEFRIRVMAFLEKHEEVGEGSR